MQTVYLNQGMAVTMTKRMTTTMQTSKKTHMQNIYAYAPENEDANGNAKIKAQTQTQCSIQSREIHQGAR